jgi:hypothetical protein
MAFLKVHGGTKFMANKDQPKGAEPFGRIGRLSEYVADATIYPGDLVKLHADGTVTPAAAGDASVGVAATYAAADAQVLVYDDPDQLFVIQSDDASEPSAQDDIGLNYNIVVGSANATYRRSAMELDGSTGATTATLPLRLIRILPAVDNALGANAKCVVKINNHQLGSSTGVAGV